MNRVVATIGLMLVVPACLFCFAEVALSLLIASHVHRFGNFEGVRFTVPELLFVGAVFLMAGILLFWVAKKLIYKPGSN